MNNLDLKVKFSAMTSSGVVFEGSCEGIELTVWHTHPVQYYCSKLLEYYSEYRNYTITVWDSNATHKHVVKDIRSNAKYAFDAGFAQVWVPEELLTS